MHFISIMPSNEMDFASNIIPSFPPLLTRHTIPMHQVFPPLLTTILRWFLHHFLPDLLMFFLLFAGIVCASWLVRVLVTIPCWCSRQDFYPSRSGQGFYHFRLFCWVFHKDENRSLSLFFLLVVGIVCGSWLVVVLIAVPFCQRQGFYPSRSGQFSTISVWFFFFGFSQRRKWKFVPVFLPLCRNRMWIVASWSSDPFC